MSTYLRSLPSIVVLAIVACAVLIAGCGTGGGGYAPVYAGTLEVNNNLNSLEDIVDIEVSEPFGPYYGYFADQYVLPGESWFLDLYPSSYDVTIYWSDFLVETYAVDICDQLTTTIFAFN